MKREISEFRKSQYRRGKIHGFLTLLDGYAGSLFSAHFALLAPPGRRFPSHNHYRNRCNAHEIGIAPRFLRNRKAQAWYMDLVAGIFIFVIGLVTYYYANTNISNENQELFNDISREADAVSSQLLTSGYPPQWDNATVQKIGVAEGNRLDEQKWLRFSQMPYEESRKTLGTGFEFFVFVEGEEENITNILGVCGIGHPLVNATIDLKAAYYYADDTDSYLKEFMNASFSAAIYKKGVSGQDFPALIGALSNYSLVVMEHPGLQSQDLDEYRDELEDFVEEGHFLLLSGNIIIPQGRDMLGVEFAKKSGQAISDRNATTITEDPLLSLTVGESFLFAQAYYIINESIASANMTYVVSFNADGTTALASWRFGSGQVLFFSDFDVGQFSSDFVAKVGAAAAKMANARCLPIGIGHLTYRNLVRKEHPIFHDGKFKKIVVYLWR